MNNGHITVMIVEDEQLLLDVITRKMELSKVKPLSFNRGVPALAYLNSKSEDITLPDIIWLDYKVPDIDAVTFLQELNKNQNLAKIPVVVVSNYDDPEYMWKAKELGAKEFFLKTEHRLDELVETISKYVS